MPSLSIKPPRLALGLVPASILSTTLCALFFTVERDPVSYGFILFALLISIFDVYYLVRYLQRRNTLTRDALDGGNAWPDVPLFSGEWEQDLHFRGALTVVWMHFIAGPNILSEKPAMDLRWSEDKLAIALAGTYWLGLLSHVAVLIQAIIVRKREDKVLCATAHRMRCKNCKVFEEKLGEQAAFPTRLPLHPARVLLSSLFVSVIFLYAIQKKFDFNDEKLYLLSIIPSLSILHHLFFLSRLRRFSRRKNSSPSWPATPIFARKWEAMAYIIGLLLLFVVQVPAMILVAEENQLTFWREGSVEIIIGLSYILATIILATGMVFGVIMITAEARAKCERDGHEWKCSRLCTLDEEAGQATATTTDVIPVDSEKQDKVLRCRLPLISTSKYSSLLSLVDSPRVGSQCSRCRRCLVRFLSELGIGGVA